MKNHAASFKMLLKHLYPNYYCCCPVLNGFYGLVLSAGHKPDMSQNDHVWAQYSQ